MPAELTWRKAIDKVLGASAVPLRYNEITEKIIADGLRQNIGATPAATVNAQISASIKNDGASSPIRINLRVPRVDNSMSRVFFSGLAGGADRA